MTVPALILTAVLTGEADLRPVPLLTAAQALAAGAVVEVAAKDDKRPRPHLVKVARALYKYAADAATREDATDGA